MFYRKDKNKLIIALKYADLTLYRLTKTYALENDLMTADVIIAACGKDSYKEIRIHCSSVGTLINFFIAKCVKQYLLEQSNK